MEREYQAHREAQSRIQERGVRESARQSSTPQNGNTEMGNYPPLPRPPPTRSVSDHTDRTSTSYSTSSLISASTSTPTTVDFEAEHHLLSGFQEAQSSQNRYIRHSTRESRQSGAMSEQRILPPLSLAPATFSTRNISSQPAVAGPSRLPHHSPNFAHNRLPPVQYEDRVYNEEEYVLLYEPRTPSRLQGPGISGSRSSRTHPRNRSTRPVGHRSITEPTSFSRNLISRGQLYAEDVHSHNYSVDFDRVTMSEVSRGVGGRPRARFSNVRGNGGGNRGRLESVRDQESEFDMAEQESSGFDYEGEWGRDKNRVPQFVSAPVTPIAVSAVASSQTALTRVFEEREDDGEGSRFARRDYIVGIRGTGGDEGGSGSYLPRVDPSALLAHSSTLHGRRAVYTNYRASNDHNSQSRSRSRSPDAYSRIPLRSLAGPGVSSDGSVGRPSLRRRPASAPLTSIASQASTSPALSSNPGHGSGSNPHEGDVDVVGDIEMRASESDHPPPPSSISPASTAPPLPSSGYSETERYGYQHHENTSTGFESAAANPTDSHESNTNTGSALRSGNLEAIQETRAPRSSNISHSTGSSDRRTETRPTLDRSHNSGSTHPDDDGNNKISDNSVTTPAPIDEDGEIEDVRGRRRIRLSTPPGVRVRRSVSANASIPESVEGISRASERGHHVPPRSTYPTTPAPPFPPYSSTFSSDTRHISSEQEREREWEFRRHQPHEYAFVPLTPVQPSQHPYAYGYSNTVTPNQSNATLPPISSVLSSSHGPLPPPSALPLPLPSPSERYGRRVVTAPVQSSSLAESSSSFRHARTSAQTIDPSLRPSSPAGTAAVPTSSSRSSRPIEEEMPDRHTLSPLRPINVSRSSRPFESSSSSYISPRLRPVGGTSQSRSPSRRLPSSEHFTFSYPPTGPPPSGSYLPPHATGYPHHPSHYPPPPHYYDRPPYNYPPHPQPYPYAYDYRHAPPPHPSLRYEQEYGYYPPPPLQWESPPMSSMTPNTSAGRTNPYMPHTRPWSPGAQAPPPPVQHTISPSLRHAVARAREQESEGERERKEKEKDEDKSRDVEMLYGSGDVNVKDDTSQIEEASGRGKKGKAKGTTTPSRGKGTTSRRGKSSPSKSRSGSRGRGGKATASSSTPRRSSKGKGKEKISPESKESASPEFGLGLAATSPSVGPSRKRARVEGDGSVFVAEQEVVEFDEGDDVEDTRGSSSGRGKRKAKRRVSSRKGKERETSAAGSGEKEEGSKYRRVPRDKVQVACKYCRGRKMKCDGQLPCMTCQTKGRGKECTYPLYVNRRGPGKKPKKTTSASGGVTQTTGASSSMTMDAGPSTRTRGRQYHVHVAPGAEMDAMRNINIAGLSETGVQLAGDERGFEYVTGAQQIEGQGFGIGVGIPASLPHPSTHPHGPPPAGQLSRTNTTSANTTTTTGILHQPQSYPTSYPSGLNYPEHAHLEGTGWNTTGRSQRVPVVFTTSTSPNEEGGSGAEQARSVQVSASVSPRIRPSHGGTTYRSGISHSSTAFRVSQQQHQQQQQQFDPTSGTYIVHTGAEVYSPSGPGPSSSSMQSSAGYGVGDKRKAQDEDDENENDEGDPEGGEDVFDDEDDDGGDELDEDEDDEDEDDDEYRPSGTRSSSFRRRR